jgi:monofunctional biosynthetic peptidoglycan transglycosylase
MLPRSSRAARAAVTIDPASCLLYCSLAARESLLRRPFGDRSQDLAAAAIARTLLYSPKLRPPQDRSRLFRILRRVALTAALLHVAFILSTSTTLLILKRVNPGATTLMAYRALGNGWKVIPPRYLPLAKIPRATRTMTIRVEDGSFFEHHGILLAAMKHAYKLNKAFGEPVYGGSTITMQTARTIFLVPEKSYLRKYLEVIIALEMEAILGKERILELYFNYAEWGRGIFGIEAAARHHFKAGVAALSRDQSIRLVTLLSSPIVNGPYTFSRNGILQARYAYLAARWSENAAAPPPGQAEGAAAVPTAAAAPGAEDVQPGSEPVPADAGAEAVPVDPVAAESGTAAPAGAPPGTAPAGSSE